MKILIVTTLWLALRTPSFAQPAVEEAVLQPITRLFQGMKSGDSAMAHSAFVKEVAFITIRKDKTGQPLLQQNQLKEFLVAVGTSHPETWNEMIWGTQVKVDGNFAQAWANYAFYLGNKFSHCGVDAFHLFLGADGTWKIVQLADTRRRDGCDVPPSIRDQFK